MSSSTTKQPKHRVSIPAKSALKSGPSKSQSKRPAGDEDDEPVIIKKRTAPSSKKASRNNEKDDEEEGLSDLSDGADGEDEFDVNGMEVDEEEGSSDEEGDISTDEEIEGMKADRKKSKKNTKKRKAATTSDVFASTLTSLLEEPATKRPKTDSSAPPKPVKTEVNPILALSAASALPPTTKQIKIERLAKRQLKQEKIERKDRARVKDVLEGWGPRAIVVVNHDKKAEVKDEGKKAGQKGKGKGKGNNSLVQEGVEVMAPGGQEWERGLRKVAQRGVIKLFNAIVVASSNHTAPLAKDKIDAAHNDKKSKKSDKDNILGRGGKKDDVLTKEGFLGMLKNA
ncbi:hypothetical protein FFLO_01723 [Filobasidium floriforme]|uniref:Rrp15p-domain-containing protein n=1 Tax=Filobasidium floriforme TaxID=5210 RepID=A0A8K0NSG4_9TREE|nr:uncharacterized protein HD553DRAFT_295008 [Filobasidium floriforme]KAG7562894.1 hypothetical protein FFLO_01723 [Filobasidium floriforme]KAH8086413.1 hypothetical protein HD553DRAFT_295008 [Filobasidium floriforme]